MPFLRHLFISAAVLCAAAPAAAVEATRPSIAIFGGTAIEGHVWQDDSLPFVAESGDQAQIGVALAHTPWRLGLGLVVGAEAGLSLRRDGDRFGPAGTSAEIWAGPTIRHEGLPLGPVLIRPAFTFGLTAVTASHGLERARELEQDGNAGLLYFMAPEISFALKSRPGLDFVYRAQHRSGGKNVGLPAFGNMGDTTNANVFGFRWRF